MNPSDDTGLEPLLRGEEMRLKSEHDLGNMVEVGSRIDDAYIHHHIVLRIF
jgi:hypothetical protein